MLFKRCVSSIASRLKTYGVDIDFLTEWINRLLHKDFASVDPALRFYVLLIAYSSYEHYAFHEYHVGLRKKTTRNSRPLFRYKAGIATF